MPSPKNMNLVFLDCPLHLTSLFYILILPFHVWQMQRDMSVAHNWPYPHYTPYGYGPSPYLHPYPPYPPSPPTSYAPHPTAGYDSTPTIMHPYPYARYGHPSNAPSRPKSSQSNESPPSKEDEGAGNKMPVRRRLVRDSQSPISKTPVIRHECPKTSEGLPNSQQIPGSPPALPKV